VEFATDTQFVPSAVCFLAAAVYPNGNGVFRRILLFSGACTMHTATGNKCIWTN